MTAAEQCAEQESGPQTVEEYLLHPGNLKGRDHLRAGGRITHSPKATVNVKWSEEDSEHILEFLRTGDIDKLVRFVQSRPAAILHPVAFWQIFHLSKLLRKTGAEELGELHELGASIDPDEPTLPAGTKQAARDALQRLIGAWVRQMLPGWEIRPIKRRGKRGPKVKTPPWEREVLLIEYEDLLSASLRFSSADFKRKEGVSDPAFIEQVSQLVRKLHLNSWRSDESYRVPGEPEYDANGNLNLNAWRTRQTELPEEEYRRIAAHAIGKHRDVTKERLAWALLAHYWGFQGRDPVGAVKKTLQRVSPDRPRHR